MQLLQYQLSVTAHGHYLMNLCCAGLFQPAHLSFRLSSLLSVICCLEQVSRPRQHDCCMRDLKSHRQQKELKDLTNRRKTHTQNKAQKGTLDPCKLHSWQRWEVACRPSFATKEFLLQGMQQQKKYVVQGTPPAQRTLRTPT